MSLDMCRSKKIYFLVIIISLKKIALNLVNEILQKVTKHFTIFIIFQFCILEFWEKNLFLYKKNKEKLKERELRE